MSGRMKASVDIASIAIDGGTQVRASIDESVVAEYAERMAEGATFPPVVLYHDGNHYYLADGFHRLMASRRLGLAEIASEIRPGTKTDALWFALGANKANAHQMTMADKKHAILLAIKAWPERSIKQIAEQIGVNQGYAGKVRQQVNATVNLPDRVTGKDGKSYPASRPVKDGGGAKLKMPDRSKAALTQRRQDIADMAERGFSTRQIASAVGIGEESVGAIAKREGITIHADRIIGKTRRLDSNRIVDQMVMDAEHLTADENLITFADLDADKIAAWVSSLEDSKRALGAFIRRLMKEQKKHGEAA